MFPGLRRYVMEMEAEFNQIPQERKDILVKLADYLQQRKEKGEAIALNFICTHNSRRSHISQIWAAAAAAYYGVELTTFSGGTEATAFNPRAVAAMERAGFQIEKPGGENPKYQVAFSGEHEPMVCFSKTFDDPVNPKSNFAAIMTCSHADANCPFIPGASFRLSVTYEDPKESDDSPRETEVYDERVLEIGREIFYAMSLVQ